MYVCEIGAVDRTRVAWVGGKGASLGELARLDGVEVPVGFCVTVDAFRRALAEVPTIDEKLEALSGLELDDRPALRRLCAEIREHIDGIAIPEDVRAPIARALERCGSQSPYAVRSSATAEDLPAASFAGQHDTHLHVVGEEAILRHLRLCWASLFTERAVVYRQKNGIDHRKVLMAVVVQRMVAADVSGVLFTADPVSGHRKVAILEAVRGLGDALVSGLVRPDVYRVRDGVVVGRQIAQADAVLTDAQAVRLAELGRRIEAHFGTPQDIEWCLVGDEIQIVQSRPITTLFPIPEAPDHENRVYVSVGHQQMMTDAMKPLGLSLWKLTSRAPMVDAGGRLFVDVTAGLASPTRREGILTALGKSDPLIGDALRSILDRGDFVRTVPDEGPAGPPPSPPAPLETDPTVVEELIAENRSSLERLRHEIRGRSGTELVDFIREDIRELQRLLFAPRSHQVILAAMQATWWLNDKLGEWLGEKNPADVLTQSAPNNVTSEMGLALLDVADAIRPHPQVVAFLRSVEDDGFLDDLLGLEGGREARDAIWAFLDKYGMRCVGEIDITRPRWSERPSTLLPILLSHVDNHEPGEAKRRFERGQEEARRKEHEILERLRTLPDGERKAEETRRMIERVRTFAGYREYPKYGMVSRYFVYKKALLDEAERLVRAGVLREKEDIFFLDFHELRKVVEENRVDEALLRERKEAFEFHRTLEPPRVLTSDGEIVAGAYRRDDVPPGALVGLAVSAGTVEGRARVVFDLQNADLEPGDILVTTFTDPSWTPLFLSIGGLVTEVGGLMTHGAVVAREYGLPAVVGVERATRLIRDGQRIRVHGTEGYVELLA